MDGVSRHHVTTGEPQGFVLDPLLLERCSWMERRPFFTGQGTLKEPDTVDCVLPGLDSINGGVFSGMI